MGNTAQPNLEKVIVRMDITSAKGKVLLIFAKAFESTQIRRLRDRFRGSPVIGNVQLHPDHLVVIDFNAEKTRPRLHSLTTHLSEVCAEEGYGELEFELHPQLVA